MQIIRTHYVSYAKTYSNDIDNYLIVSVVAMSMFCPNLIVDVKFWVISTTTCTEELIDFFIAASTESLQTQLWCCLDHEVSIWLIRMRF